MRLTPKRTSPGNFDVIVTSMLDINFLLIMFFIMTAYFQRETHALMDLPQERGDRQKHVDEAGLVINIMSDGRIMASQRSVSMQELAGLVRQQLEQLPEGAADQLKLMVRADRHASTQHLNDVLTMLRQEGVAVIRLGTEIPR